MILQIYAIWINQSTFGVYIKPEIIEEKNAYNLSFIEDSVPDSVLFESDNDES